MSVIERNIEEMKEELKQRFVTTAQINYGRELSGLDEHEIYETLAQVVKQYTSENWIKTNKQYQENDEKQVYYFSIEFLLGRLLNTNLINLDLKNALKAMLKELNLDLNNLYSEEPDAGLGNGDSRDLLDGRGAAVVIDRDLVQNGGVGAACADGGQLMDEVVDTGIHFFFIGFRRAAHNEILLILR